MLTNNQLALPIKKWLHAMKIQLCFQPKHFMIDCSDIETLGINWAYSNNKPKILFCDCHLLKVLIKKGKSVLLAGNDVLPNQCTKISQELQKSTKDGFLKLINGNTLELFDEEWRQYQEKWSAFPQWIQHIEHK